MSLLAKKILMYAPVTQVAYRTFSYSGSNWSNHQCKLLVVGGGAGGCSVAARFARKLGKDAVIVLEPSDDHYYQALFTLVGAGVKTVADCRRNAKDVLPKNAVWLKDAAADFNPNKNSVTTCKGDEIRYEYMVIAVGVKYDYEKIPGLLDALKRPDSMVCTTYGPGDCSKVFSTLQAFKGGEAVFCHPGGGPIKCPGAPQKIAYLADSYFRKTGVRSSTNISFNPALPFIFGVKKYADALQLVAKRKDIAVNYQRDLIEIKSDSREAVFVDCDDRTKTHTMKYDMLHAIPHMSPPDCLKQNKKLVDDKGYLDVDKFTLQHKEFPNIYGLGDCTNTPNSKTAAAIAKQNYILAVNLAATMSNRPLPAKYEGYASCPLVTDYGKCILAEFDYNLKPVETMPINQAQELRISYYMKKDLFPFLYWTFMLPGYWRGPDFIRKIINPFGKG